MFDKTEILMSASQTLTKLLTIVIYVTVIGTEVQVHKNNFSGGQLFSACL
jgi:hypothetical protein